MAGVSTEQGDNKLNVELNLVPFIDLLSTLVLFLLVTAVWLQVAAIPTSVKSKGRSASSVPSPAKVLAIHVSPDGYHLEWPAALAKTGHYPRFIARSRAGFDTEHLTQAVAAAAKTHALVSATVSGDDRVDYGSIIQAIDVTKTGGGVSVGLSTN
jgi:biopolymer transport protein ExbD